MATRADSPATTNMADEEDASEADVLLPCTVCSRRFNPRSLTKHVVICEKTAARKRKPFDSAKQRIQGTELAEFLPKQQQSTHEPRRGAPYGDCAGPQTRKPSVAAWKQSRDEFLRAIRAARGDSGDSHHHVGASSSHAGNQHGQHSHHGGQHSHHSHHQHQHHQQQQQRPSTLSLVSAPGAPQRSNEKGQCPTCQRQFGVKSYERHVAFCRERATRLPASPQTSNNVAKERLEARMKYRAPALKNRRPTNREKYSPGGPSKSLLVQSPLLARSPLKDAAGPYAASSKSVEATSPKLPVLKRPGQINKDSPSANNGPLKSRPMDRSNSGAGKDYNPFLLAEQQLNDLFSDTSDQSSTDGSAICPTPQKPSSSPNFPLSLSSAFAKYPNNNNNSPTSKNNDTNSTSGSQQQNGGPDKRVSVIAPPSGFDDLTSSDISSDCTETNSVSRDLFTSSSNSASIAGREHVLGRRVIIDQSQALGGGEFAPAAGETATSASAPVQGRPANGTGPRTARPLGACARSSSLRSSSAPKPPERKISSSSSSGGSETAARPASKGPPLARHPLPGGPNYRSLNGSNLSLSSVLSSTDADMKRSNSLFDELLSSFEDEVNSSSTLPSLVSLMRNDLSVSLLSGVQHNGQNGHNGHNGHNAHNVHNGHQRSNNGRINCSDDDADLSSPESVKRQECGGKLSADSAYSSLNRKNSINGRNANDVNKFSKLSKFCHQCGFKFPDSAKFCCDCGVKRLTL